MTKIIAGFPGIGEECLRNFDFNQFINAKTAILNPDFPQNYINAIKAEIGKLNIIYVSSHKIIRDALRENNIKYILVYPAKRLKLEYIYRCSKGGCDFNFIKFLYYNWDILINEIEEETFPTKLKLWDGEELNDIFIKDYCSFYKEFCSIKETNADEYEGNPCSGCKIRQKLC